MKKLDLSMLGNADRKTVERLAELCQPVSKKKQNKLWNRLQGCSGKEWQAGCESEVYIYRPLKRRKAAAIAASLAAVVIGISGTFYVLSRFSAPNKNIREQYCSVEGTSKVTSTENVTTTVTSANTEAVTAEIEEAPVEVGDGLYRVSSIPKPEQVSLPCKYGEVNLSEGGTVEAYGKTIDFSKLPNEHKDETTPHNDRIVYCVCDEGKTVYFANSYAVYKADTDLNSPELFEWEENQNEYLYGILIRDLISLNNTDLLFYHDSERFGGINVKNKTADFVSCNSSMKSVPCNAGVMLYDYAAAREGRNSTVLYWECGKVYEIPLQNPNESELGVKISLNGKYICSYMRGKAEDGRLVERYSIYDTKSGRLVKRFDWTAAKMKVGDHTNKALPFVYINEETESAYFYNNEDRYYYQFYFGDRL